MAGPSQRNPASFQISDLFCKTISAHDTDQGVPATIAYDFAVGAIIGFLRPQQTRMKPNRARGVQGPSEVESFGFGGGGGGGGVLDGTWAAVNDETSKWYQASSQDELKDSCTSTQRKVS